MYNSDPLACEFSYFLYGKLETVNYRNLVSMPIQHGGGRAIKINSPSNYSIE